MVNKKILRPCNKQGCGQITQNSYCVEHKEAVAENNRYYDKHHRTSQSKQFYHSSAWKRARKIVLIRDNGLCVECRKNKRLTMGTIVDHIIPVKQDWSKRLDEDNLQTLCQSCHNKKTGTEKKNQF